MAIEKKCKELGLEQYIHTFAPTAGFKCCCDSCGNDTKRWIRSMVKNHKISCSTARDVWKACIKDMPQPNPVTDL
jgi:hypothetical protein